MARFYRSRKKKAAYKMVKTIKRLRYKLRKIGYRM